MFSKMVQYGGKLCLAPMVRSGELPTRVMALAHHADLVWLPEIIDKKLVTTKRVVNEKLGTVEYLDTSHNIDYTKPKNKNKKVPIVFATCPSIESGKLIFQIGSSNPEIAVEAASKVIQDVDGIDLNCGCPKPFSTHAGMGAALLSTPDLLCDILTNLVEKVGRPNKKPISCKIRLLDKDDPQPTLDLCEKLCRTGIANITIHCRTRNMRNREEPIHEVLGPIIKYIQSQNISVILNGNIQTRADFENLQHKLGNYEVGGMIAESAETNPSVFSSKPPLIWNKVVKEYVLTAIRFDNFSSNTKYILLNQVPGKSPYYQLFCKLKTNEEFLQLAESIPDSESCIKLKNCQKDVLISSENYTSITKKRPMETENVAKKQKIVAVN